MDNEKIIKITGIGPAEKRIDAFLSSEIEGMSRNGIQRLIEEGAVEVNGAVCDSKKMKVGEGDEIRIIVPEPKKLDVKAENLPIDIVYEDDHLLVVDKAKGMVVHPAQTTPDGTLVNAVMYHCAGRLSSINGVERPGIVHRIDKDTSGLLVIAKTDAAHESLAAQLAEHSVTRAYLALVHDNIKDDSGRIDLPIGRDPKNRLRMAVTTKNSKRAVTNYTVLERFGKATLIEARLETGRTHQIRVHMAYMKHPLIGDPVYGPAKSKYRDMGQMLHAYILGFIHPATGEYMEFRSELPEEFREMLEKFRLSSR